MCWQSERHSSHSVNYILYCILYTILYTVYYTVNYILYCILYAILSTIYYTVYCISENYSVGRYLANLSASMKLLE